MAFFCIGSPHKNKNWYDYRVYQNLIDELEGLGHKYKVGAINRIYFLGAPLRDDYPDVGTFDPLANNIALLYCHADKIRNWHGFNHIFAASTGMKYFLLLRKLKKMDFSGKKYLPDWHKVKVLPPFSSLKNNSTVKKDYSCDISFVGSQRIRPIVEDTLDIVKKHNINFKIFGYDWDAYEGNPIAKDYWQGSGIPYEDFPALANSSKICLVDHPEDLNREATVSHKYIDLLASKACVISDYNLGVKYGYKGLTYKTRAELETMILKLLGDNKLRESIKLRQFSLAERLTTLETVKQIVKRFV